MDVALAAPRSPNRGINPMFNSIFKPAHIALSLNTILTLPILEKQPPTDTYAAYIVCPINNTSSGK